jgi:hypothetical protein
MKRRVKKLLFDSCSSGFLFSRKKGKYNPLQEDYADQNKMRHGRHDCAEIEGDDGQIQMKSKPTAASSSQQAVALKVPLDQTSGFAKSKEEFFRLDPLTVDGLTRSSVLLWRGDHHGGQQCGEPESKRIVQGTQLRSRL